MLIGMLLWQTAIMSGLFAIASAVYQMSPLQSMAFWSIAIALFKACVKAAIEFTTVPAYRCIPDITYHVGRRLGTLNDLR